MTSTIDSGLTNKFNRGVVSSDAFARVDIDRVENSGEIMTNFAPTQRGGMSFRPGFENISNIDVLSVTGGILREFKTRIDSALMTVHTPDGDMRFFLEDGTPITYGPALTTSTVTNGDFASGLTGWTSEPVTTGSSIAAVSSIVSLSCYSNEDEVAIWQDVSVTAGDYGKLHILSFKVANRHPGRIRIGKASGSVGSSDYHDITLNKGVAELRFYPDSDFKITLSNQIAGPVNFDWALNVQPGGGLTTQATLDTTEAYRHSDDYDNAIALRNQRTVVVDNSMYFAVSKDSWPVVLTRYDNDSFAFEIYQNYEGPYLPINTDVTESFTINNPSDDVIITTTTAFKTINTHEGLTLSITPLGQKSTAVGKQNGIVTPAILVIGTTAVDRNFTYSITTPGGYNDIVLEKSLDQFHWIEVLSLTTGSSVGATTYTDGLSDDWYYRMRIKDVGSATDVVMELLYGNGEREAHFINLTTSTLPTKQFTGYADERPSGPGPTYNWYEGAWGGRNNWPTAVGHYQGRLWWGGDAVDGSKVDVLDNFNRNDDGADSAIRRVVRGGDSKDCLWFAESSRFMLGMDASEITIRASGIAGSVTDTDCGVNRSSNYGSANIQAVVVDGGVVFVHRDLERLIHSVYSFTKDSSESKDLTILNNEILSPGVLKLAIVRSPETRIYALLSDWTIAVLNFEPLEDVLAWSLIEYGHTGKQISDIAVFRGVSGDDRLWLYVYAGSNEDYVARQASPRTTLGASLSTHYDGYIEYGANGTTFTGLDHFDGLDVMAWIDGVEYGPYTVTAGSITASTGSTTNAVIGMPYNADFKTTVLSDHTNKHVLNKTKRVLNTGLIMKNYVPGSVKLGPDFTSLKSMPALEDGTALTTVTDYNYEAFDFDGDSEVDPRICIRATGPCNIMSLSYEIKDTDRRTKTKGA